MRNPFRLDDANPFTGRHMLAVVFAFFGTIITVNLIMAFLATGTFPGLVVKNSYVASQNFNSRMADSRALREAGWRMAASNGEGIFAVRLADREGASLRDLDVTAAVGRPSTTAEDRTLVLAEDEVGYRATEALPPGQWVVAVEARRDGELVFAERTRIQVSGDE